MMSMGGAQGGHNVIAAAHAQARAKSGPVKWCRTHPYSIPSLTYGGFNDLGVTHTLLRATFDRRKRGSSVRDGVLDGGWRKVYAPPSEGVVVEGQNQPSTHRVRAGPMATVQVSNPAPPTTTQLKKPEVASSRIGPPRGSTPASIPGVWACYSWRLGARL